MNLGMLRAQPRDVVAKLNGMSAGDAHKVLEAVPSVYSNDHGEPCYTVAAVRLVAQDYRSQITLGSMLQRVTQIDKDVAQITTDVAQISTSVQGCKDNIVDLTESHAFVRCELNLLRKAYINDPKKPYLTNRDIQEATGWGAVKVRKCAAMPEFRACMIHGTRKGSKHKKYSVAVRDVVEKMLTKENQRNKRRAYRSQKRSSQKP